MAQYWTAIQVLNQVAGELGLPRVTTITNIVDVQSVQLLSLLNSGGNELLQYYAWEQFVKEWTVNTIQGQSTYALPSDLAYFIDQTQWDRSNQWPLLGPKSAQEWAWLKGSGTATLPRLRYRIAGDFLTIYPADTSGILLAMEYVSKNWVTVSGSTPTTDMVVASDNVVNYNPWLLIKFIKFKFYELKGFNTAGVGGDFMRIFTNLTGKDVGASKLSLVGRSDSVGYIEGHSVPEGNWNL